MRIDRHNYEECFILYWDNELTASQKQAIENFVKENPDLQEEFTVLGEARFTPDSKIQFEEKNFLLNSSTINITNYEERLLSYIDDELNPEERKEIERSAEKNPLVQKELSLLQKTKLQPEAELVFPGKSDLYRTEEKISVIRMTWFRVAVAAAIILITGFAVLQLVNANRVRDDVARVDEAKTPSTKSGNSSTSSEGQKSPDQTPVDERTTKVNTGDNKKETGTNKKNDIKPVIENKDQQSSVVAYQPENKNNLPKESERPGEIEPTKVGNTEVAILDKKDIDGATAAINTVLTDFDVTPKDNISLYIPEPEKEKGGLKGFLRKTTRVFERRTKIQTTTEDNKLLVGAFALSLK